MKTKVLLFTDLESQIGENIITHSTWISSIRDYIGVENLTTVANNNDYHSFTMATQQYDFVIILAELTWYNGLSIEQQVNRVQLDGFALIEDLRKKHQYNKPILILSNFSKDVFWKKGDVVVKAGSILQESHFHPFFELTEDGVLGKIKGHLEQINPPFISKKRLKEICSEYFTLEGMLRAFFHDIANPRGTINLVEELKRLSTELKVKQATQYVQIVEEFIKKHSSPILTDLIPLKDELLKQVLNTGNGSFDFDFNFDRLGTILYIEDEESWQGTVKEIFIKRGMPKDQFLAIKSWDEAYVLIEERNLDIAKISNKQSGLFEKELINTVIVDAKLLDANGEKQLYQGVDIVKKLEEIGYFSIIVLSNSERFVQDNITHQKTQIIGFSKRYLEETTGCEIFSDRVIETGYKTALEKTVVPYTINGWYYPSDKMGKANCSKSLDRMYNLFLRTKQYQYEHKRFEEIKGKVNKMHEKNGWISYNFEIDGWIDFEKVDYGGSTFEINHIEPRLALLNISQKAIVDRNSIYHKVFNEKDNNFYIKLGRCIKINKNDTMRIVQNLLDSKTIEEQITYAAGKLYWHELQFLNSLKIK